MEVIYTAYQIAAIQVTLNDLDVLQLLHASSNEIFSYSCAPAAGQDFEWHGASRGPSATAELLVDLVLI